MEAEGVEFCPSTYVGAAEHAEDGLTVHTPEALQAEFDAVVFTGGSETPRDLTVPGRELLGVHFAIAFLRQQNKIGKSSFWEIECQFVLFHLFAVLFQTKHTLHH